MEIKPPATPDIINIFVENISENKKLTDFRLSRRYGDMEFGTIGQLAKNLGIAYEISDGGIIFHAPKARLQMFVEKLHFATVSYRQI